MSINAFSAVKSGTQDTDCSSVATGAYHSVAGYKSISGLAQAATMANTKILTVQLMQATDAAGTGAKVLGAAVTNTAGAAGGAAAVAAASVESMDVAGGFTFVAVRTSGDEAVPASSVVLLSGGRFS